MTATRWMTWIGGATMLGALVLAVCVFLMGGQPVLRAWFVAVLTLGAVPVGCLALLITNHLLRRDVFLARVLEAGCYGLWPLAVAFLPIALFPGAIYPWTAPEFRPTGALQEVWLDSTWFGLRAVLYFAVWLGCAMLLIREDRVVAPGDRRTGTAVAAAMLYAATISFAGLDWCMTLNPEFASSGYGWMMAAHQVAAALGFAVFADDLLTDDPEPPAVVRGLMIGGVLIWAFFAYMEWMVIWSGNVPAMASWYLDRDGGVWPSLRWVVALLMAAGVAGALLVPLWPRTRLVRLAALCILVGQLLEGVWNLLPAFGPATLAQVALFLLSMLTVGGALAVVFLKALATRPPEADQEDAVGAAVGPA
ncbi:hypothetical protein [Indioceanicola profundi]|uniref:hypothetical protein n=1 Tax=Indioceanicola profundi TaxID=2220096 RepID=UPI000E6AAFB5|nr:hypothetical protein [Indioceanicola profundi]